MNHQSLLVEEAKLGLQADGAASGETMRDEVDGVRRRLGLRSCWLAIAGAVAVLQAGVCVAEDAAKGRGAPAGPGAWAGWERRKIGDAEYVSLESVRKFYRFDKLERAGGVLTLSGKKVVGRFVIGSSECRLNGVKLMLVRPVLEDGALIWLSRTDLVRVIEPTLHPHLSVPDLKVETVVLDPGHGGNDRGAVGDAGVCLGIAMRVKSRLEGKGMRVVMTRDADHEVSLAKRAARANEVAGGVVVVSIHLGPVGLDHWCVQTSVMPPPVAVDSGSKTRVRNIGTGSACLAAAVHGNLVRGLGTTVRDQGLLPVERVDGPVLPEVWHPAITVRLGYPATSAEEGMGRINLYFQEAAAIAIANGVDQYRKVVDRRVLAQQSRQER